MDTGSVWLTVTYTINRATRASVYIFGNGLSLALNAQSVLIHCGEARSASRQKYFLSNSLTGMGFEK